MDTGIIISKTARETRETRSKGNQWTDKKTLVFYFKIS